MQSMRSSSFLSHSFFPQHEGLHVLCMYMRGFLCKCTYPLNIQAKEEKKENEKKKKAKLVKSDAL